MRAGPVGAARHGRDHGHLVALLDGRRSIGIRPVSREPDEVAPGGEGRVLCHEGVPGIGHRRAIGQVETDFARAGQLALGREEPHADVHRD